MCLKGCLLSGLEGGLCTHVVGELQRRAIELKWEEWYSGTVNPRTTQVVAGVEGKPRVFFLTPEPHQPPRWTQSAMVMAMHGEKVTPCGCAQCMTHCAQLAMEAPELMGISLACYSVAEMLPGLLSQPTEM